MGQYRSTVCKNLSRFCHALMGSALQYGLHDIQLSVFPLFHTLKQGINFSNYPQI